MGQGCYWIHRNECNPSTLEELGNCLWSCGKFLLNVFNVGKTSSFENEFVLRHD